MQIIENNAKACVSMQRCDLRVAAFHNSREGFIPESSRTELAKKNKCSCSALAALQKIQKWDQKADENYAKTHGGRKSPVKEQNKVWEAVINLNDRHTLKDVKKLVKKLEKITGYRAAQIALHKDEGHINEDGDFVRNIHAHVIFYARDLKTGLSLSAANYARKDLMRQMQDAVADELGMERGRPAEETGKKHLSPRAFKAQKRQEAAINANNKEWEQKLEKNNQEWEAKKAAWEQKQAEREARQAEWERKIPEIMAARERRSKFICEHLDWESARTGKMLAREMQILGMNFAGINNPQGNILVEAQKHAIRNIFYMLGATAQLAVFLMKKTLQNDEKLAADAKIYNVESTLLRAVDYIANSDKANGEELKKLIQRKFLLIPEEKRRELFEYAIENAPTPELQNDIKALIEGRFEDIAKSEQAQRRIENRDLRAELKAYGEEIRKIKEDLRAMEEENRILVAAERAILKEKGAERSEYAEQEAQNRERLDEIKKLKDEAKQINNTIREQKQPEQKDAQTIREQAQKIKELTDKIAEITEENAKKQKELEEELKQEKAARERAEIITPQMLDAAFEKIDELEGRLKEREEQKQPEPEPKIEPEPVKTEPKSEPAKIKPKPKPEPIRDQKQNPDKDAQTIREQAEKIEELTSKIAQISAENVAKQKELEAENKARQTARQTAPQTPPKDAFDIIDELEEQLKQREEQKPAPKPEPEPKIEPEQPKPKKDDFISIFGYETPKPEPRRRFGDYERKTYDDRPKYEPEPEKIEPEPFRDPWAEIENDLERWKKADSEVDKKMLSLQILQNIEKYEKSGWDIPLHRQLSIDSFRRAASYDPADVIHRERELELEKKRQAAELEKKYEDVKKSVKQEADARQTNLKKKRNDELEMGGI